MHTSNTEQKKYKLVHIEDILDIPTDRLDDFITDLKKWHSASKGVKDLIKAVSEASGIESKERITMNWIDDGKHDGHIIFKSDQKLSQERGK